MIHIFSYFEVIFAFALYWQSCVIALYLIHHPK